MTLRSSIGYFFFDCIDKCNDFNPTNNGMYAIQHKQSGNLIDICPTMAKAKSWLDRHPELEAVSTRNSKVEVCYCEPSGPGGYGCNIPEFITYGSPKRCVTNLYKWMQRSARVFGPDYKEVRDYFRHCRLYVDGRDKSSWIYSQVDKIVKDKMIFV